MPTTITCTEATRRRLADYKRGGLSYDAVLNMLMDAVPIEDVAAEAIAEHYRRLKDPRRMSLDEFEARVGRKARETGRRERGAAVRRRGGPKGGGRRRRPG